MLAAGAKPARLYYATLQACPCTPSLFFPSFFPFLSISHQDLRDQTFPSKHELPPEYPPPPYFPLKRDVRGERRRKEQRKRRKEFRGSDATPLNPGGETLGVFAPDNECVGNRGEDCGEVGVREASSCRDLFLECMCDRGREG